MDKQQTYLNDDAQAILGAIKFNLDKSWGEALDALIDLAYQQGRTDSLESINEMLAKQKVKA